MTQLTRNEARALAAKWDFRWNANFHALPSDEVDNIIAAADSRGYRKPRNANGSRARYFHAYVRRCAEREE